MYRVRSTDLWYNAPGVVAAYQPVAAPDAFAARQNVSNDLRRVGVYDAKLGVAPAWSAANGWYFDGTSQYFNSGVIPQKTTSALVRFANAQVSNYQTLFGSFGAFGVYFTIGNAVAISHGPYIIYGNTEYRGATSSCTKGVLGLAAGKCYQDGALVTVLGGWSGTATMPIYLGAYNPLLWTYVPSSAQQAAMITHVDLSHAHMVQYSRQMAYCHVNPDWNAWGRRRQYFYAPSQMAGFQAAWAARQNRLIGGGSS